MKTKIVIVLENDAGKEVERAVEEVSDPDDVTLVLLHVLRREDWVIGSGDKLRIDPL